MVSHGLFVGWLFGALCSSLLCTSLLPRSARAQDLPAQAQELPVPAQAQELPRPEPPSAMTAQPAPTDTCEGAPDGRAVILSFGELEATLADAVRADLKAELAGRGIAVCQADAKPATLLASVRVDPHAGERVVLVVSDHATDKEVTRDVALAHLPENGRALAIAIAIDELLRASWAELSLARDMEPPSEPAPPPVAVEPTPQAPVLLEKKANRWLSVQASYSAIPDRHRALGAQLTFDALPWRALWVEGRLGAAKAEARDVGPGDVSIASLVAGATGGACLEAAKLPVRGCVGASMNVDTLFMRAKADPGSTAQDAVEPLVSAAATFGLLVPLGQRLIATGSASVGGVISGVRITDEVQTLLSLQGLIMTAALGLGVSL